MNQASTASTQPPARPLDDSLRANLQLGAQVSSVLALIGNRAFDRHLLPGDADPRIASLEGVLMNALQTQALWVADPQQGTVTLHRANPDFASGCELPSKVGQAQPMSVSQAVQALRQVRAGELTARVCLLVDAHLLLEDAASPRDADFALVRDIEGLARQRDPQRLLALRVTRPADLAAPWRDSPFIRQVNLPQAARDERHTYASLRLQGMALKTPDGQPVPVDEWAAAVAACTEDWTLTDIESLLTTAREKGVSRQSELEDLAVALRLGTTATPWSGELIRQAVRRADEQLSQHVLGQPEAMREMVRFLSHAAAGLSVNGRRTQAPRGVKLLVGPSGVGKTEAAKACSELIFGQEQLLRFDLGEFQQEHALARLIGAPPGYVGHGSGGELTEGVRRKPNSVVLLDEVEKAAPRLWDGLLGVFDDGRMTDGQGQVTYFGQPLILLTSNMGMTRQEVGPDGQVQRVLRFEYETPYQELQAGLREAVYNELAGRMGRPELLGRIGGVEAIIVFDFLRDPVGVARKFAHNVAQHCRAQHGADAVITDDVLALVAQRFLEDRPGLMLGARSVADKLKRLAVVPLDEFVLQQDVRGRTLTVGLRGEEVVIHSR